MNLRERYLIPLLFLVSAIAYAAPIFSPLRAIHSADPVRDWDWLKVAALEHHARQSLSQGSLALWSPYFGGGYPIIAHPEDASLSPLTLPSYLLGEAVGLKIELVAALFFGAWGLYLVCRRVFGQSPPAAATAALALLVAGWMAWRVRYGWPMHFGYYLFPFVFYFTARAREDRRYLFAAAAVMVVILQTIAQGLPFFFLFLFLWSLGTDLTEWRRGARLPRTINVILLGIATGLLGAFKVAGLLKLMAANPRSVAYDEYLPLDHFYAGLPEWGHYIISEADVFYKNIGLGPWIAFLALAGLVFAFRRLWPLLPALALFVWIGSGPNAPLDLFGLLHHLPVFGSMHWPMKYVNFFVALTLCIFAGGAIEFVIGRAAGRWRWVIVVAAVAPLIPLALTHMRLMDRSFTRSDAPFTLAVAQEFRQVAAFEGERRGAGRPEQANMYWLLLQNEGLIDWDGDLLLPEYAVPAERIQFDGSRMPEPAYRGEAYLLGAGKVESFTVGVNELTAAGQADEPTLLVINQNYDRGWNDAVEHMGLLARQVGPGPFRETFRYRPMWFFSGCLISLLTALTMTLLLWREARGRKKTP